MQYKFENLPDSPGVYLFKNEKGRIIYIGKAKVLKNRVRSYFNGIPDGRPQFEALVDAIKDVEVIVTRSETEALILESNLIRRHLPRFNVFIRDSKFFPYLRVTNEKFPRVLLTRKMVKDGSTYYGPFSEVKQIRRLVKTFKASFQIRNCNLDITDDSIRRKKHKICLDYHIKLCGGPCEGLVDETAYRSNVESLVSMVKGHTSGVIKRLEHDMRRASEELRFEEAARLRDQRKAIEDFAARQAILFLDNLDRDILGLARTDDDGCVALMKVRQGRMLGREHFYLKGVAEKEAGVILTAFIQDYYLQSDFVPREIFLPAPPEDVEILRTWLCGKRGGAVDIFIPRRGVKVQPLKLAEANAELLLGERRREIESRDRIPHSLKALEQHLKLPAVPRIIECFDISNTAGGQPTASMVQFKDGKAAKSEYRHYKIKHVEGINDFAMMAEAVKRRYSRLLKEEKELPDLIIVDGGKGQLSAALQSLRELEITNQPVIGLAKRLEEIFQQGSSEPVTLPKTSSALKLLQRIRDEAHRFAIIHHRNLRGKTSIASVLDDIPGVGAARKRLLLKHFGSIKKISIAGEDELASIKGIDKRTAAAVAGHFNNTAGKSNIKGSLNG
ncbi:excinuclease ABC subunit C [bacterium]|nr:excinuclease ABC subunit C [bacterium]